MKIVRILKGAGIISSYGSMGAAAVTLIEDELKILVDTGHFGNRDVLLKRLSAEDIKPDDIDKIVLTHINWDHCLNVDLFPNASIVVSKKELEDGSLSGQRDIITTYFRDYLSSRKIILAEDKKAITKHSYILMTPGHTPGHISLVIDDDGNNIIISGDSIPNIRSYRRGLPDFIFYSKEEAMSSISRIKKLNPSMIIPGHDPPFNENGYLENDTIDIVLRNEDETNSIIKVNKDKAGEPVEFNE